ncbi:MAG: acyl carrier protein [Actinomycetota bacterium]|nr:acyl carrier protein [Actinomycetota bacterium]
MDDEIRGVLASFGRLPIDVQSLGRDDDLYRAGLSSHASVNVMLGLENTFDIEFPDSLLRKSTFQSIVSIASALTSLGVEHAVHE